MEQPRPPARLVDDAADLRARLDAEVTDPARRAWLRVQVVALETHARALAGEALPYLEHVVRCFDFEPRRRPETEFETAAATIDRHPPRSGRPARPAGRLGRAARRPARPPPADPRLAGRRLPRTRSRALRAAGRRGPARLARDRAAVVGLQLVRRRAPVPGRPQHGPADPRPGPARDHEPRDVPRAPPRARLEGGGARHPPGSPRGEHPAHQRPRVPDQRGPGRGRSPVRDPGCGRGRPPRRSCSSAPPCRWPPTRPGPGPRPRSRRRSAGRGPPSGRST